MLSDCITAVSFSGLHTSVAVLCAGPLAADGDKYGILRECSVHTGRKLSSTGVRLVDKGG